MRVVVLGREVGPGGVNPDVLESFSPVIRHLNLPKLIEEFTIGFRLTNAFGADIAGNLVGLLELVHGDDVVKEHHGLVGDDLLHGLIFILLLQLVEID